MFDKNVRLRVSDKAEQFAGRIGYFKAMAMGKVVLSDRPLDEKGNRILFSVFPADCSKEET